MFNDEGSARWIFGAIGTGAFFGLLTLEALNNANGISFLGLLLEAIELLLMIAAVGGITLVFGRMHANHLEKVALIRDLQAARIEGADLRRQGKACFRRANQPAAGTATLLSGSAAGAPDLRQNARGANQVLSFAIKRFKDSPLPRCALPCGTPYSGKNGTKLSAGV